MSNETQYKIKKMIEALNLMEEIDKTFYIPINKQIRPFIESRRNLLKSFETNNIKYTEKQYKILEQKKIHFLRLESGRMWNWYEKEVDTITEQCKNWFKLDRKSIQKINRYLEEYRKSY